MKKINLIIGLSLLLFSSACTKSSDQSEAASKNVNILKDCSFDVFVFASYRDNNGKMKFDFEKFFGWSADGTHDYAVEAKNQIKSASVEIVKEGKTLKKIDFTLEKAGAKLVHFNDKREVVSHIKSMSEEDREASVMRFVLVNKEKKTCKKEYKIY